MRKRESFVKLFISCTVAGLIIFSATTHHKLRSYEICTDTYIRSVVSENTYLKESMTAVMSESEKLKDQLATVQESCAQVQDKKKTYGNTRGLRNNNPCNIKSSNKVKWDGQVGSDGEFIIFESPEYGIRACAKILKNYQHEKGIDTLRGMVYRLGPPHENNTEKYVRDLSNIVKLDPDKKFDVLKHLPEIIKGIIFLENGRMPYPDKMFIGYTIFK